ncbi:MAG: 4'-phosphopantetheinyl transferase family protein [Bryobacteraceae bacterium]
MISVPLGRLAPDSLTLASGELHVWRSRLDMASCEQASLEETLSHDERLRAARFRFGKDRDRFVLARGVLRNILGRYLGSDPAQLRFSYGPFGKPVLASECNIGDFRFNLSHCQGVALFAFTRTREVGIDLERMQENMAEEAIAERFFSCTELSVLRSFSWNTRREAFLRCWTSKEAYLKARGEGLRIDLNTFDFSTIAVEPSCKITDEKSHWLVSTFNPFPNYVAALAAERDDYQAYLWDWQIGPPTKLNPIECIQPPRPVVLHKFT